MDWAAFLNDARAWLAEEGITRSGAIVGAGSAAILAGLWRLIRRGRAAQPERTVVSVNAAKGESVSIRTGHYADQ